MIVNKLLCACSVSSSVCRGPWIHWNKSCYRFYFYYATYRDASSASNNVHLETGNSVGLDAGRRDVWSTSTQIRCKSVGYMNVWSQQGCPAGGRRARGVGNRRPRSGRHQRQPLLWHDEPPTATTAASPSALQQSVISNQYLTSTMFRIFESVRFWQQTLSNFSLSTINFSLYC